MKILHLENAGMEIRELMQSFCAEPLPECLTSIRIFQNSDDVFVKYYWKHNSPLGKVLESENVASLYDYLDRNGQPRFSLDASIVKNAVVFCSDDSVQQSIIEYNPEIDDEDITIFDKALLADESISVRLLSVNKMMMSEGRLIIHFLLKNNTNKLIRVILHNITAKYYDIEGICIQDEIQYDTDFITIGDLNANECKKCSVILDDDGFYDYNPFADLATDRAITGLRFQIAFDDGDDAGYGVIPPLCFDGGFYKCWFEYEEYDEEDDGEIYEVENNSDDNKNEDIGKEPGKNAEETGLAPNTTDKEKTGEKLVFTYNDIVVKIFSFQLEKQYSIQTVSVWINVMRPDGELLRKNVPGGYCKEKDFFFILDSDYRDLSKLGVLMCRIVPREQVDQVLNGGTISGLNPESLLRQYGYTVKNGVLTERQRRSILKTVIDERAYTPTRLLSFLDWLIKTNEHQQNMGDAIDKWQADRNFIKEYILTQNIPVTNNLLDNDIAKDLTIIIEQYIIKNQNKLPPTGKIWGKS